MHKDMPRKDSPKPRSRSRASKDSTDTYFIPLSLARKFESLAAQRGVSKVARGEQRSRITDGGFFEAAKRADGRRSRLKKMPVKRGADQMWWERRNDFCSRHRAQQKQQGTPALETKGKYKGTPTRRELGLLMWMCSSLTPAQLKQTLPRVREITK